ncbi:type II secretion system F family protein [Haloarculaceae archaeon H-GB11]|nr:type II secretion system F family protein [Haloarculaceae archaeon H-GB11]
MGTTETSEQGTPSADETRSLSVLDRALYALFSRHADEAAHAVDRRRYRASNLGTGFDVYLSRVYGLSWVAFGVAMLLTVATTLVLTPGTMDGVVTFLASGLPVLNRVTLPDVPRSLVAIVLGSVVATVVKWTTVSLGGQYLRWVSQSRRVDIEETLPGAVRYLRVLASGSDDPATMLRRVATQETYGGTAAAFRRALNEASLTGSLDAGLERVARDTPSHDRLAPFVLKFREHANQGRESLEEYLEMEGRLLSRQQARIHQRVSGYLELLSELFVVLLVLPALFVLILTVMSVFASGLSKTVTLPVGAVTVRALLVYLSAIFVLGVGLGTASLVTTLRPSHHAAPTYERPQSVTAILETTTSNPASAVVLCAPFAVTLGGGLWSLGYGPTNVVLLTYVGFGLPVGLVAVRRARLDDAKDREIRDFVHAVSGHVSLGRPFPEAVRRVAEEVDHGALQSDVETLAFTLGLTTSTEGTETNVRAAALDRFVEDVGTPLAEQTIGLVVGALDAGSDTERVFDTLQTEIGTLYHQRKELRSNLVVYVAVGWTTGLLVLGIVVAVNTFVLDDFAQLATVSQGSEGLALDPDAVRPARSRHRFYLVTQATMLACGWFAGVASRGKYEALLHSSALVALTYVVFAGTGGT